MPLVRMNGGVGGSKVYDMSASVDTEIITQDITIYDNGVWTKPTKLKLPDGGYNAYMNVVEEASQIKLYALGSYPFLLFEIYSSIIDDLNFTTDTQVELTMYASNMVAGHYNGSNSENRFIQFLAIKDTNRYIFKNTTENMAMEDKTYSLSSDIFNTVSNENHMEIQVRSNTQRFSSTSDYLYIKKIDIKDAAKDFNTLNLVGNCVVKKGTIIKFCLTEDVTINSFKINNIEFETKENSYKKGVVKLYFDGHKWMQENILDAELLKEETVYQSIVKNGVACSGITLSGEYANLTTENDKLKLTLSSTMPCFGLQFNGAILPTKDMQLKITYDSGNLESAYYPYFELYYNNYTVHRWGFKVDSGKKTTTYYQYEEDDVESSNLPIVRVKNTSSLSSGRYYWYIHDLEMVKTHYTLSLSGEFESPFVNDTISFYLDNKTVFDTLMINGVEYEIDKKCLIGNCVLRWDGNKFISIGKNIDYDVVWEFEYVPSQNSYIYVNYGKTKVINTGVKVEDFHNYILMAWTGNTDSMLTGERNFHYFNQLGNSSSVFVNSGNETVAAFSASLNKDGELTLTGTSRNSNYTYPAFISKMQLIKLPPRKSIQTISNTSMSLGSAYGYKGFEFDISNVVPEKTLFFGANRENSYYTSSDFKTIITENNVRFVLDSSININSTYKVCGIVYEIE